MEARLNLRVLRHRTGVCRTAMVQAELGGTAHPSPGLGQPGDSDPSGG
jgi:hypothetical protein